MPLSRVKTNSIATGNITSALITSVANTAIVGRIATSQQPTGTVLQVKSTSKTDTFTTSSTSYVDVTGLSISITPSSATSNILVMYQFSASVDEAVQGIFMQLVRDSTAIFIGDAAGSRPRATTTVGSGGQYIAINNAGSFLDSPATTSATTYKVQMFVNGGSAAYVNRTVGDRNTSLYDGRTPSSITVMEIAG